MTKPRQNNTMRHSCPCRSSKHEIPSNENEIPCWIKARLQANAQAQCNLQAAREAGIEEEAGGKAEVERSIWNKPLTIVQVDQLLDIAAISFAVVMICWGDRLCTGSLYAFLMTP